jgi:predicted DCC family thiol-disulfide oxidoreductase YuxK
LQNTASDAPILLYDGTCNLCNATVDFMLRFDRQSKIHLAASQSQTAKVLAARFPEAAVNETVVLVHAGKVYTRSDAAFKILGYLPFPWPLLKVFELVPRLIRDRVYSIIANNRHKWFGTQVECRLSVEGYDERFLP